MIESSLTYLDWLLILILFALSGWWIAKCINDSKEELEGKK